MQEELRYSNHHIIGKSENRNFHTDELCNILRMQHKKHNAVHTLFTNENRPKEQLRLFVDLIASVLNQDVLNHLYEITELENKKFYKKEIIKK